MLGIRPLDQCQTLSWYYSLMEIGWLPGYCSPPVSSAGKSSGGKVEAER